MKPTRNTDPFPNRTMEPSLTATPTATDDGVAREPKVADFAPNSATSNAPSADAGNERETYDAR